MGEDIWRQADDWHWVGPDGWTICKIWSRGDYRYELWQPGGQCAVDTRDNLKAAKVRYNEIVKQ